MTWPPMKEDGLFRYGIMPGDEGLNTESCDMRHRAERPESVWDLAIGEYYFGIDGQGQRFFTGMLPGQTVCIIPLRPVITAGLNGGRYWDWDGNEDKPTLTPSINAVGSWHGWVRAGRMASC